MSTIFRIQVFFEESHAETRPYYDEAIKWLCAKGFDARASDLLDTFFVYYESLNESTLNLYSFRDKLDQYLLTVSIRNNNNNNFLINYKF